jgi:hypothetical protein
MAGYGSAVVQSCHFCFVELSLIPKTRTRNDSMYRFSIGGCRSRIELSFASGCSSVRQVKYSSRVSCISVSFTISSEKRVNVSL